jgi:hypothetical protein
VDLTGLNTSASSIYTYNSGFWGSAYAIDGIYSTSDKFYWHSATESYPWIQVDLQDQKIITMIKVADRRDHPAHYPQ